MSFITSGVAVFSVTVPFPVTGFVASNPTLTTIDLVWNSSRAATLYSIVSSPSTTTETTSGTSYTFTGLTPGIEYTFIITPSNAVASGAQTSSNSIFTIAPPLPGSGPAMSTPTNVTQTTMDLAWTVYYVPTYATSFNIYAYSVLGGLLGFVNVPISSFSYTYTGLIANTEYYFTVAGVNVTGVGPEGTPCPNTFTLQLPSSIGTAQWAARISGSGYDQGFSIAVDGSENSYVIGTYDSNPLTIYNANGSAFVPPLALSGFGDVCIVKYDTAGAALWATHIVDAGYNYNYGISADSAGNVYATGTYVVSTLTLYDSNGSPSAISLTNSTGGNNAFIVKYNTSGTALWAAQIEGFSNDLGYGISVDSTSNVYVTGKFEGTTTIYNSGGASSGITLTSAGSQDAFIVKYNTSGTALWAAQIGGSSNDLGYGISVDSTSNVYVTGKFEGTTTIYNSGGASSGITLTSGGINDVFVVKYNINGTALWATKMSGTDFQDGRSISADGTGNVYVTGDYFVSNPLTIYNSDGSTFPTPLPNAGGFDLSFIVKYDINGFVIWAAYNDAADNTGVGIVADTVGNCTTTGRYSAPLTIYNSDTTPYGTTLPNSGSFDAYVINYDPSGMVQWAAHVGGSNFDLGTGISVNSTGKLSVVGSYDYNPTTIYNDGGASSGITLANSGTRDIFIVKYD
jgi:hypothetical protein